MSRSSELSGFTLFHHPGKGWQMSVRRKQESGWDVKIIPDEQAAVILSMLETSGYPDGPWSVKNAERRPASGVSVPTEGGAASTGLSEESCAASRLPGAAAGARGRLTEAINGMA